MDIERCPHYDPSDALEAVQGDVELLRQLLDSFFAEGRVIINRLQDESGMPLKVALGPVRRAFRSRSTSSARLEALSASTPAERSTSAGLLGLRLGLLFEHSGAG